MEKAERDYEELLKLFNKHNGKEKVFFIGLNELIKNKLTIKRKQDKADLEILLAAKE